MVVLSVLHTVDNGLVGGGGVKSLITVTNTDNIRDVTMHQESMGGKTRYKCEMICNDLGKNESRHKV